MNDTFYNVPQEKQRLVAAQQRDGGRMDGTIISRPRSRGSPCAPIGGGGLFSTASDYGRFLRMLLNGGALDGAHVLSPETVALMGHNHIGAVSVPAHNSAQPDAAAI